MKTKIVVVGLFFLATSAIPLTAAAQPSSDAAVDAEALFKARCSACHEPAIERAPGREQLRARSSQEITEALTSGIMQPMAQGLGPAEIGALAGLLGGRPAEGSNNAGIAAPASAPASPPAIKSAPADVAASILAKLRAVTPAMAANPSPGDWLQWARTQDAQNFSPLTTINRNNIATLAPAWRAALQPGPSMPMPVVHDGVMFLQTTPDVVLALNAANGELLWRHVYVPSVPSSQKMGLSLSGDRVFVPTSDLHVIALDAKTGAQVWDHEIELSAPATNRRDFQLRSAPLIVGDKVIQGVTASGAPGGGYIVGLDIATGRELWRFHTIPRPGEPGGNSWNGIPIEERKGASVWDQGSYDKSLNLVYFGVGQTYDTAPLLKRSSDPSVNNDALYTDSTLALDPNTGRLVWYYQHLANDQWDLDWVFERQLTTMKVAGKTRRVVATIGKMGILDALDARTGAYLFSIDAGTQNVIASIDPKTGAKTIDPNKIPDVTRPTLICPGVSGARAWPATSMNAKSQKVFVPITEWCLTFGSQGAKLLSSPGAQFTNANHPDADKDGMMGRLQAMDLSGHKRDWNHDLPAPISTSVLATAGGVVFSGDLDPALKAFDDRDGKLLWTAPLDNFPSSSVITYAVGKVQYVAVVTGLRNNHVNDLSRRYQAFRRGRGETAPNPNGAPAIQVFALNGGAAQ